MNIEASDPSATGNSSADTPPATELAALPAETPKSAHFASNLQTWRPIDMQPQRLRRAIVPTLKYLTETEVHTFAFSVAANAVLAFFPFMALLMTLMLGVFHSKHLSSVVLELVKTLMPIRPDRITDWLQQVVHSRVRIVPLIMLLVTSSGVFLPLEVALNQVWGFSKNRSYLRNQIVSLGLAFACGVLTLFSVALAAGPKLAKDSLSAWGQSLSSVYPHLSTFTVAISTTIFDLVMAVVATIASAGVFFLIYWLLPNGRVKPGWVLAPAAIAGILLEIGKHVYIAAFPWLGFRETYGYPIYICVSLIFWGFLSGLLLLGGAKFAAEARAPEAPE